MIVFLLLWFYSICCCFCFDFICFVLFYLFLFYLLLSLFNFICFVAFYFVSFCHFYYLHLTFLIGCCGDGNDVGSDANSECDGDGDATVDVSR